MVNEDKAFVKRMVVKTVVFSMGAHLIYKFAEWSGITEGLREVSNNIKL